VPSMPPVANHLCVWQKSMLSNNNAYSLVSNDGGT
jgi:hypothetical protein